VGKEPFEITPAMERYLAVFDIYVRRWRDAADLPLLEELKALALSDIYEEAREDRAREQRRQGET
jgi:hypothetical protein